MRVLHLSHTDLDGYACQFVTRYYLKNYDLSFYNSNYGKEIDEKFQMILNSIDSKPDEKSLILISDLNLTPAQCQDFTRQVNERKNAKLLLLDHHISGEQSAKEYSWYFLDDTKCAAKICYDFFSEIFGKNEKLGDFIQVVNCVDIWLSDEKEFELGKVCMGAIANAKELNKVMFNDETMDYTFYLLEKFCDFVGKDDAHIALDNAIHSIKKEFFSSSTDNTLNNLVSAYVVKLLTKQKDKMSVIYKGKKGIVTTNINDVSIIGNDFLVANSDYDFFINTTSKKTLSFRGNGKIDVSKMAYDLVGGGGHVNASGGFFANFKDSYDYAEIRAQIQALINEKTGEK